MSDNDEDLFADSDDTNDLIAESKKVVSEKPNKRLKRKRADGGSKKDIPDADDGSDSDGGDKSLFDSDDSDDGSGGDSPPAKKKSLKQKNDTSGMSKRERMEALQKKKRLALGGTSDNQENKRQRENPKQQQQQNHRDDDEESVNSAEIQLTEEDKNFIDTEGDDADAINELYAEQHFDDVEAEEDDGYSKKGRGGRGGGGGGGGRRRRSDEAIEDKGDSNNPIMQAVNKMKRKKKEQKAPSELEEEAKEFVARMEEAAREDEAAVAERRPAMKKLSMLSDVMDMLPRQDMTRRLLDCDLLSACRRWIQPLPNGTLGNITIRQKILDAVSKMTGENGVTPYDLKKSEFGKVVMTLCMHKSETPAMKRQLRALIEQWSRPIFQKSGNMKDLERVQSERGMSQHGLSHYSRMQQVEDQRMSMAEKRKSNSGRDHHDLQTMITSGSSKNNKDALKRVRVPQSKGFQFSIQPEHRMKKLPDGTVVHEGGDAAAARAGRAKDSQSRGNLSRRMMEKSRKISKNQRSANVSVEGRKTK